MKVKHILVSLLFVFLLYHFTCKCRVEGLVDMCQGGNLQKLPFRDSDTEEINYCVYKEGDKISDNGCEIDYKEYGNSYDEIWCKYGIGEAPDGTVQKWGKCGDWKPGYPGVPPIWVYDDDGKLVCKSCPYNQDCGSEDTQVPVR